ncbi:hypothetical protein KIW84_045683 [Lathyrus oleraceus]|uniref:Reverse transcriptase domain-containing protein n=1 Tax=Pisum sativum TaxID=3888 RepID=A0A9D4XJ61_PEA|nr:hypothetical protein KIW84_045683 [Pisum sativum]
MAGEQHSDHSRPLVNYNMDDGPPSHEADVRDGHPSTPSPEPQNNGDASHAHNLGAETFHPIPVPVEGDAVMIAMVNALNQAGSMLHQQHERIMALEAERQEARPQPVSRIQQRSEPTKKRGRRSPEPYASRARARRDGGRARTSPRRGHSPDNNELSPLRSDEEDLHCPLSRAIMEAPLPKGMEKPPNLAVYDGTTDPDDHEAVEVDTTEHMKKYLLERGLLPGSELSRAVGIEPPRTLNELLHKAQAYIRYEEKQVAHNARSGRNAGETEHSKREDTSISRRNGDKRREERPRELREGRGPAGRYSEYTLLTAPRERILAECINSEFKQGRVRFPKPSAPKPHTDKSKYCRFHRSHGHVTEDCVHLKDAIEILIQEGHLKQYTRKNEAPRHDEPEKKRPRENTPPDNSPYQVALCVSRPEDFFLPEPLPEGKITALSPWEDFPTTLVISGGGTNGESAALSVKRKFDELLLTAPEQKATLTKYRGKSNPISFFLEELPGGSPNSAIPLLIRAKMARFDMKYYTKLGRVVTIHGDIEAARRCYDAAVKGQAVVSTKSNCNNKKLKTEDPARGVNAIDLDCRIGLDETEEGRFPKERSLEHPVRPIPDGEFELIPLGDDPERTVKIVIPVEIRTPTRRTEEPLDEEMNDETLRAELDLVDEIRSEAALRETTLKQKIALRHDAKVIKREFQVGTLVLRRNQKNPREGKLAANWEGPYRKNLDNITAKYATGRRGRYGHALRPQNPREEPRDPGTIRGHITNTTLPDGWDLDQDPTSKYQDWQGTQLAMGGPKPRDQGSNNGPGLRYPRAQSPTLRRFPKPRRLTKSSRVRIHANKYQTQTSTMNGNENIHTLETIKAAEAKYARRPYYNARRPKYIRHAGHDKKNI